MILVAQSFCYVLAVLEFAGFELPLLRRLQSMSTTVVVLNVTALVAFRNAWSGKTEVWA
jgi:hypothetical protein